MHQTIADELMFQVRRVCPPHLKVYSSSGDVREGVHSSVIPDVVTVRRADISRPTGLYTGVPLLTVEVGSPSTRSVDRTCKRGYYAGLGVPSCWLIDRNRTWADPTITVLRLDPAGRAYETDRVVGPRDLLEVTEPFPYRIRPAELIDI